MTSMLNIFCFSENVMQINLEKYYYESESASIKEAITPQDGIIAK